MWRHGGWKTSYTSAKQTIGYRMNIGHKKPSCYSETDLIWLWFPFTVRKASFACYLSTNSFSPSVSAVDFHLKFSLMKSYRVQRQALFCVTFMICLLSYNFGHNFTIQVHVWCERVMHHRNTSNVVERLPIFYKKLLILIGSGQWDNIINIHLWSYLHLCSHWWMHSLFSLLIQKFYSWNFN